jgi:precorrin-2/cobalt-factor-2 C20-methyltransferase
MTGILYGLGLGPGDPDLVTIKAAGILADVEVIAYVTPLKDDRPRESFARAIADPHLETTKTEILIPMPMSEDSAPGKLAYDQASKEIAIHLDAGRDVAVLCEGDPLLYGSFMYVLERLKKSYEILTVPGVSSLSAAAAAANQPLVSRNQSITLIPATLPENQIRTRLKAADSAAIFKVGRNIAKVKNLVDDLNLMDGALYIERASLPSGRVMPLMDAPDEAPYFSMVILT